MRNWLTISLAVLIAVATTSALAQAGPKLAVMDSSRVFNECKEGKKSLASMKDYHDRKQAEINAKETDLKALEDKTKDPKISDDKKEEIKTQFTQKMYEYQAFAKAAQDEMEQKQQKAENEFGEKLQGVVTKYAQAKGLTMVFEKRACFFSAEGVDVTAEVIAEMNKAYPGT